MVYLVAIFRQIQGLNDLPTAPRTSVPLKAIADNASKPPAAERHPQGMGRIRYQTKVSYPICEPWCWNLSTFARTKSPSFVGKYTIHGAYGYQIIIFSGRMLSHQSISWMILVLNDRFLWLIHLSQIKPGSDARGKARLHHFILLHLRLTTLGTPRRKNAGITTPNPWLLLNAQRDLNFNVYWSYMINVRWLPCSGPVSAE